MKEGRIISWNADKKQIELEILSSSASQSTYPGTLNACCFVHHWGAACVRHLGPYIISSASFLTSFCPHSFLKKSSTGCARRPCSDLAARLCVAPDLYTGGNESPEHFLKLRQHIWMNVLRHTVLLDSHLTFGV